MAVKKSKPAAKAAKRSSPARKPVLVCSACGLEVMVTNGEAEAATLVCCDLVMKPKK